MTRKTNLSGLQIQKILELRKDGLSYARIGRVVSCSPQTAWEHCNPDRKQGTDVEYNTKYYNANKEREKKRVSTWIKNNRVYDTVKCSERRVCRIQATPRNQTFCEKWKINCIYSEAARLSKETGIKRHVDHIYPLKGKNSCGRHVSWNLQILTAEENMKKNNKLPGEF